MNANTKILLSRAVIGRAKTAGARLALVLVAGLALLATDAAAAIGLGSRSTTATFDGVKFAIYTYRPKCTEPGILFIHHGAGRDANSYRDAGKSVADRRCLVVIAPLYPESQFSSAEYNRGNVYPGKGPSTWSTRFEAPMIKWAAAQLGGNPAVYLFGHSGGGQFLSRVAAFERLTNVQQYVVANPSTYVWPSLSENIPYGFDRLSTSEAEKQALEEYLALPVTIYLGSLDNDPNDPDLSSGSAAMRQGDTRLERGENVFAEAKRVAAANGWQFNWQVVIAPGVGHSGGGMLRSPAMDDALAPAVAASSACVCSN